MKRIKNVLIFFLAMVMLGACRDKKSEKKEEENIQQENTFVNPLKTEGAQCWANYYDGWYYYMQEAVDFFHAFMYSDVYTNPIAKGEESKVDGIIGSLFDYYLKHPDKMPDEMQLIASREGVSRAVCDYISGMTDGYAMEKYSEIFIPMSWTVK